MSLDAVPLDADDQSWFDAMLARLLDDVKTGTPSAPPDAIIAEVAERLVGELEYWVAHGDARALRVLRAYMAIGLELLIRPIREEREAGRPGAPDEPAAVRELLEEAERRFAADPRPALPPPAAN
jgi:hypothetical protein